MNTFDLVYFLSICLLFRRYLLQQSCSVCNLATTATKIKNKKISSAVTITMTAS